MATDYTKEQHYLKAKKKVEKLKGFYRHFIIYIIANIFISGYITYQLMNDGGYSFTEASTNFWAHSTWLFWGIGVFFHALGTFGFPFLLGKEWEEKKLKELMNKQNERKS